MQSLKKLCGDSDEVMVYGLSVRNCRLVSAAINKGGMKAYNFAEWPFHKFNHQLNRGSSNYGKSYLKAIITSLIFENFKRYKNKQPLIPFIFFVELEIDGKKIQLDIKKVAESTTAWTKNLSDSELRRCFKLCFDNFDDNDFRELARQIALNTIKFVRLINHGNSEVSIEEVKPFWDENIWKACWKERKVEKWSQSGGRLFSPNSSWRWELSQKMHDYNNKKISNDERILSLSTKLSKM